MPALNEESAVGLVIREIPRDVVDEVVVVDNGSTDATVEVARDAGATVLHEPRRGYGAACWRGAEYALERGCDIIVFLDADHSDYPEEIPALLEPILSDSSDLVIGSRSRGEREDGAMLGHALFGNWLSTTLIRLLWGTRFTDLGPFRAITADALRTIDMRDRGFGWTVEMQARAARLKLRCAEVPVRYRVRIGKSKVSGTIVGSAKAGAKILWTIAREALRKPARP